MSVRAAALWSMGSQYISFAINFIVSVIISRYYLTPSEVGLFSMALAAALVISILQDFGISRFIIGEKDLTPETIQTASSVSFIFAWGVALCVMALAWPLSAAYQEPRLIPLVLIIGASYFVLPFAIVPTALLIRAMNFKAMMVINVGSALAFAATAIALAMLGFSASSLAWAQIATFLSKAVIAQWLHPVPLRLPPRLKGSGPILRFGSASSVLFISGTVGTRTPDLIIGALLNTTAVGLFSRATALSDQLRTLVSGAITSVFYPAFARLRDQGEALGPYYIRVVSGYCAITWPAMVALSFASEPLVLLLYGEKWMAAAPLLKWAALSQVFFVALPLHMDIPILLGRIKPLIRYNVAETLVSIITLIIAARWSVEWAALSRIAYGLVWYLIYFRFMRDMIQFSWKAMLSVYLKSALVTFAAIIPFLISYSFWRAPLDLGFSGLLLCTVSGIAAWLGALFAIRHPARTEVSEIFHTVMVKVGLRNASQAA
jgi:O-antigen/teichoic acid export membrane protein